MEAFLNDLQFSNLTKEEPSVIQASVIDTIVNAYYSKEAQPPVGPTDLVTQLMQNDAKLMAEIEGLQSTLSVALARMRELELQNSELMKRVLQLQASPDRAAGKTRSAQDSYVLTDDLTVHSLHMSPLV